MTESLSRTPIRITVKGEGEARGELVRFSAPLTVENILAILPIDSRAHPRRGGYSMIIGIGRGVEKGMNSVEAGDIAYWPMGDSLVIYPRSTETYGPVNTVGKVTENLDIFQDLEGGIRIRIEKA
ncbi:MAG: cyclophilin-like fold protein [Candidatus Bathyarchaeota archaeon]